MKIEVGALGLKTVREKKGLTQRKQAHDLGISQVTYFGCRFEDLFEVVLVDPESGREQVLGARPGKS